jgi:hypothetical protein
MGDNMNAIKKNAKILIDASKEVVSSPECRANS